MWDCAVHVSIETCRYLGVNVREALEEVVGGGGFPDTPKREAMDDPWLDKSAAVGFVGDQSMSLRAIMLLAIMIRPFSGRRRVAV